MNEQKNWMKSSFERILKNWTEMKLASKERIDVGARNSWNELMEREIIKLEWMKNERIANCKERINEQ